MKNHASLTLVQRLSLPIQLFEKSVQTLMPLADLLLRFYVAKIFLMAGLSKTQDWDMTIALFSDEYQVPWLNAQAAAWTSTLIELVFSVMLLFGLWRSLAAFALLLLNLMAVVSYYHVLKDIPAGLQDHLEWGLMLFLLLCLPVQKLSLDYFLNRNK